jgi:catechol 1,2-dioxygenase
MLPPTPEAVEGPFYRPDAPMLEAPCRLVRRPGERGAVLVFSGRVCSPTGDPLPGALLDLWHASAEGLYSPGHGGPGPDGLFDDRQPPFNLRGRLRAGNDGEFELTTIIPGAYHELGWALDDVGLRPAHLHARVSHPGFATLTTQIFFEEDPHLGSDPAGQVQPGLVTSLERRCDAADLAARGLARAYFACEFAFILRSG